MKKKILTFLILFITLFATSLIVSCDNPEEETPKLDAKLEIYDYIINGNDIILRGYKDLNDRDRFDELFIPACVTEIADEAFNFYSLTKKVVFEENSKLKTIGNKAFNSCTLLTEIKIPSSVKNIGNNAFSNCTEMTEIVIPRTVENLGYNVFEGSNALTVYCEAETKPSGWNDSFNEFNAPIVWNSNNNEVASDGRIYKVINGVRYSLLDGEAYVVRQPYFTKKAEVSSTVSYNSKDYTVTKICDKAFYECTELTYASIPTTVNNIGKDAYFHCYKLLEISYLGSIDEWVSKIVFDGPVLQNGIGLRIDDKIVTEAKISTATKISKNAFSDCSRIISLEIPNTVTVIEDDAFKDCYNLLLSCQVSQKPSGWSENLNVKTIIWDSDNNDVATNGNIYTKVDGVNYEILGNEAKLYFQDENITSLTIPTEIVYKNQPYNVVGTTDSALFFYLYNLKNIIYEGSVDEWLTLKFSDAPFGHAENFYVNGDIVTEITISPSTKINCGPAFGYYKKLTKVTVSEGVTSIPPIFGYCENLTEVKLPSTLTYIGDGAFNNCTSLKSIVIPKSVKVIENSAFSNCSTLTSIIIEENSELNSIGSKAFEGCLRLPKITIPATVKTMGENVFYPCNNLTIYCEINEDAILDVWNKNWNASNNPVVWNSNNNDVASDGYIYTIVNDCNYKIKDGEATFIRPNKVFPNLIIPKSITYKDKVYPVTEISNVTPDWDSRSLTTSVVIPDTVKILSDYAFYCLEKLTMVSISPNSRLQKIGYACFSNCESLTSIFIPKTVTNIEDYSFFNCNKLTIYCAVDEKVSTWRYYWAYYDGYNECPIVWGYKGE